MDPHLKMELFSLRPQDCHTKSYKAHSNSSHGFSADNDQNDGFKTRTFFHGPHWDWMAWLGKSLKAWSDERQEKVFFPMGVKIMVN